jgi:hypothetical protein
MNDEFGMIYLEELREFMETSVRINDVLAEIRNKHLSYTSQENYQPVQ